MSDPTPAFESPTFESPSFADADEELDDDFDQVDDSEDDDGGPDDEDDENDDDFEDELEPAEPVEQVNRIEGGAAKAVLEHVARSIVDDPDAVAVDVGSDRSGVRLSLHVAPSDMGRIIGKRGRVAQALRSVVRAAAAKDGTDASVDIVD